MQNTMQIDQTSCKHLDGEARRGTVGKKANLYPKYVPIFLWKNHRHLQGRSGPKHTNGWQIS